MTYRKLKNTGYYLMTYGAAIIAVTMLFLIGQFLFIKGSRLIQPEMFRNPYWSENILVGFAQQRPFDATLHQVVDHQGKTLLLINEIGADSIVHEAIDLSAGPNHKQPKRIKVGSHLEKVTYIDEQGVLQVGGALFGDQPEVLMSRLTRAQTIQEMYIQTPGGGVGGSIKATFMLIGLSVVLAFPLGIGAALYLNEVAKKTRLTRLLSASIDMLAGVPSIIFGLMGMVVLYPVVSFFGVTGRSIVLGALTMAVLLLPVIIRSVQESLKVVPQSQRDASLSLGATQTQTMLRVVLPAAIPGILSALILSISRVIGESAALIFTMGTFINDQPKYQEGATTLAVHIWSVMSQEKPNFELASAISLVILVIVLVLNLVIKLSAKRLRKGAL